MSYLSVQETSDFGAKYNQGTNMRNTFAPTIADLKTEKIKTIPLLAGIKATDFYEQFAQKVEHLRRRKGANLFYVGDDGDKLYLILKGKVRIELLTKEDKNVQIAVRQTGDMIGELSLFREGAKRMADAVCAEDCELLALHRHDLLVLLERYPELALRLLTTLADRLSEAALKMAEQHNLDVTGRTAATLLDIEKKELSQTKGEVHGAFSLTLTNRDLAERIGANPTSVCRSLTKLRKSGAIERDGKTVVILDHKKLEDLSQAM